MRRQVVVALVLAVAAPGLARAQSTPEAAAQSYGDALRANDWAAAARLMDPAALRQLRSLFEPLLATPDGVEVGLKFFGVSSAAELATLPDTTLFAAFLRGSIASEQGLADVLRTAVLTPLGHVPVGGDTVLVVTRMSFDVQGIAIHQFDVMPFVLRDGRWWGLLKADITNLAAMLRGVLGAGGE